MDYTSLWNFPGKNTGVGSLSLLQWIFPDEELNQDLPPALQVDSLPTELLGKPNIAWAELEKWGRWGLEVFPGINNNTFQGKWPHGVLRYLKEAKDG